MRPNAMALLDIDGCEGGVAATGAATLCAGGAGSQAHSNAHITQRTSALSPSHRMPHHPMKEAGLDSNKAKNSLIGQAKVRGRDRLKVRQV